MDDVLACLLLCLLPVAFLAALHYLVEGTTREQPAQVQRE